MSAQKFARTAWNAWLDQQGLRAARFQQQAWRAFGHGFSGLIAAPTGSGKTLAAIGGPLMQALALEANAPSKGGVRILWVTPLRALASDTTENLLRPVHDLLPHWRIALRTGDASAKDRAASLLGRAQLLVTTPESLAILLSHEVASASFRTLCAVVVDEWHELLPSKRGVLLQLNLARLRSLAPSHQVWGLSATLGNLPQALEALVRGPANAQAVIVQDARHKAFALRSVLPPTAVRLPWAGHLGLVNLGEVVQLLQAQRSSIVFTNTRAQAELWFSALASVWPFDASSLAIHHGSLDQQQRQLVEQRLRQQQLRCVVATSSLDLGVDFPAVDLVVQIGGAHSVARTVQRAGRAKHRPGAAVEITTVATQAMDLCEFAAVRSLAQQQVYEARAPRGMCLDVLAQHAMSMALAGGFEATSLWQEVRTTAAFAALTKQQWRSVLQFLKHGGAALHAYPQYQRLAYQDGVYVPASPQVARRHRWAIGTIADQSLVQVQFLKGAKLGSVEESFISKLAPGDVFNFAGRSLELFRVEHLTAWVRKSSKKGAVTPAWTGGYLPFSDAVGQAMKQWMDAAHRGAEDPLPPEMCYLQPLLQLQAQRSHVPRMDELLVEIVKTGRRGTKAMGAGRAWFLYPFAGRVVHEALAMLLAHRLAQIRRNTWSWSCNHMGLMLWPEVDVPETDWEWSSLLQTEALETDLQAAVNFTEIARRRFREIAQIAGLLHSQAPGARPSNRQLQVSAGLLYDVLNRYDPEHVLLQAARDEAVERDLQVPQLHALLPRWQAQHVVVRAPLQHTPLSFGLWAESLRGQLTTETWAERIRRLAQAMER